MAWPSLTHEQRLDVARRAQDAWCAQHRGVAPHQLGHAVLAWSELDTDGQARVLQDVERALTEPARYCRQWLACVRQAMG